MKKLLMLSMLTVGAVAANAQMDQIGPNAAATAWTNAYAAQDFESSFDQYDIAVVDDFTLTGATNITRVEAVIGGWNGTQQSSFAGVTNWHVNFYSSLAAAAGNVFAGDQGSFNISASSFDDSWATVNFPGTKVTFNLSGLTLGAGTHYVSVTPQVDFLTVGQMGVAESLWAGNTPGGHNAHQINPGLGFGQGADFNLGIDAAYRVVGTAVPEPASMAILGLGVAALIRRRRSK
jgi:hypothetical protein